MVLNLIINGLPSISLGSANEKGYKGVVLNLIINGLPSISYIDFPLQILSISFKPYYKWITFNIMLQCLVFLLVKISFKPYYKWITFNILANVVKFTWVSMAVLNLIINGLPSIFTFNLLIVSVNSGF